MMGRPGSGSQLLTGAAAAVAWRYALSEFICLSLLHTHYPLPAGIGTMIIALLTSTMVRGRGWRVLQALAVQVGGFAISILVTMYVAMPWSHSFFSSAWISELIFAPRDLPGWFMVILFAALTILFWYGGWYLEHGKSRFYSYYSRFDIGMSAFVVLFLAKFLLKQRGDIVIDDPTAIPAFIAFLIFGLLSIGITLRAREAGRMDTQYLPGYKTLSVLAAFCALVILVGIGLAALFMPYLTQAADAGYRVLVSVSRPMGDFITAFLRLLLSHRRESEDPSANMDSQGEGALADAAFGDGGTFPEWIIYGVIVICGAALLVGLGYLIRLFIKWLLSRTSQQTTAGAGIRWVDWLRLLQRAVRWLQTWTRTAFGTGGAGARPGGYWYGLLLKWGRRSGIDHAPCETPREYVQRLKQRFPMLSGEMDVIVALFNLETYGGLVVQPAGRLRAAAAWRTMRSPRFWFRRWSGWLRRS